MFQYNSSIELSNKPINIQNLKKTNVTSFSQYVEFHKNIFLKFYNPTYNILDSTYVEILRAIEKGQLVIYQNSEIAFAAKNKAIIGAILLLQEQSKQIYNRYLQALLKQGYEFYIFQYTKDTKIFSKISKTYGINSSQLNALYYIWDTSIIKDLDSYIEKSGGSSFWKRMRTGISKVWNKPYTEYSETEPNNIVIKNISDMTDSEVIQVQQILKVWVADKREKKDSVAEFAQFSSNLSRKDREAIRDLKVYVIMLYTNGILRTYNEVQILDKDNVLFSNYKPNYEAWDTRTEKDISGLKYYTPIRVLYNHREQLGLSDNFILYDMWGSEKLLDRKVYNNLEPLFDIDNYKDNINGLDSYKLKCLPAYKLTLSRVKVKEAKETKPQLSIF